MTRKTPTNFSNWQAERARQRGTARTRRAAFAMFHPGDNRQRLAAGQPDATGRDVFAPISADPAATSGGNVAGLPDALDGEGKPAAGSTPATELNIMPTGQKLKPSTAPVEILQANTTPKLAKKISAVTFGEPEKMRPGDPDRWIMDVICHVTGADWVTLDTAGPEKVKYGSYWLFKGYFRAIELKTGRKIDAPTAILPEIAASLIDGARAGSINDGRGVAQNVQLAIRLGTTAEGRVGNREGYAWTAKLIQGARYEAPIDIIEREAYGIAPPPQQLEYDHETGEIGEAAQ